MLTPSTIDAALPLAQLHASTGNSLVALKDTVIDALNNALTAPLCIVAKQEAEGDVIAFTKVLSDCSKYHDSHGNYPHDDLMNQAVEQISSTLQYNIKLAREVINPQISELVDGINKIYNEVSQIKVTPIDNSAATATVESGLIEEISEKFRETPYRDTPLNIKIPRPENLNDYLMTGNPHYDSAIGSTINSLGADQIEALWDKLFVQGPSRLEGIFDINSLTDQALMCIGYVMVMQVKANLPPGINAPLDDVKDHLVSLQSQLGRLISVSFNRRLINQKVGQVIVEVKPTEVIVNPDTYSSYIENGGSDEAILGAAVSGESITTANELTENKDRLEKLLATRQRVQQETQMTNAITAAVDYLRLKLNLIAKDIPDEVKASVYNNDIETIRINIENKLKLVNASLFHESWSEVRKILCLALYSHTNALQILESIDREQAAMPDGEILEVALYAIVDTLADWLAGQLERRVAVS